MASEQVLVGILTGSASDLPVMQQATAILDRFQVPYDLRVISAHRNPDLVDEYARTAEDRGLVAIICGAGRAAHLAGAVAARTVLPVIGVQVGASQLGGADALYATVQMPRGVPVATVAVGEPGAANAAILAAQILATSDEELAGRVRAQRKAMADKILGA